MAKKWISLAVILGVVAAIAAFAVRSFHRAEAHPSTENAYVSGDVFPVSSRIPGTLVSVEVGENEQVAKGQVVATLDPRDADMQIEQARTSLAEARSGLAKDRAQIEQARARIVADESRLALARTNLARFTELSRRDSAPRARLDDAVNAEAVAAADLSASQKALAAAEANLGVSEQKVKVQQARLETAQLNRSYCSIAAPCEGIVSKKSAQAGQVVNPGQPLLAIVPLGTTHVFVAANFKETELKNIRVGQRVRFHTDVTPGRTYEGWVESLSAGTGAAFSLLPAENATGNWVKIVQRLPVRIAVVPESDTDQSLRLGLSVHVEVDTQAPLRAPSAATAAAPQEPAAR
jgi:membrane fusion protein (multidrug efflux system)